MSSKHLSKMIKGIGSLVTNVIIIAFIASFVFSINIWFISDLGIIQVVLLCVAISVITKGISKIIEPSKSDDYQDSKWQRWENYDYDSSENIKNAYNQEGYGRHGYGQAPPPPPPPPNGSFSNYNPYEQNGNTTKKTTEGYNDNVNNSGQYKDQAKQFAEQAKQFAHETKRYAEQKVEEVQQRYSKENNYDATNSQHEHHDYNGNHQYSEHKQYSHQYEEYRKQYDAPNTVYHNTFIGDFKFKESYTQLAPMQINGFISDAHIDLTRVEIPYGETNIRLNCFIGDLKVHVPNDPRIGVKLVISSFIGDGKLFDQKRGGFGLNTSLETPFYHECEKKICIQLTSFIGDAKIKRVG